MVRSYRMLQMLCHHAQSRNCSVPAAEQNTRDATGWCHLMLAAVHSKYRRYVCVWNASAPPCNVDALTLNSCIAAPGRTVIDGVFEADRGRISDRQVLVR